LLLLLLLLKVTLKQNSTRIVVS